MPSAGTSGALLHHHKQGPHTTETQGLMAKLDRHMLRYMNKGPTKSEGWELQACNTTGWKGHAKRMYLGSNTTPAQGSAATIRNEWTYRKKLHTHASKHE